MSTLTMSDINTLRFELSARIKQNRGRITKGEREILAARDDTAAGIADYTAEVEALEAAASADGATVAQQLVAGEARALLTEASAMLAIANAKIAALAG